MKVRIRGPSLNKQKRTNGFYQGRRRSANAAPSLQRVREKLEETRAQQTSTSHPTFKPISHPSIAKKKKKKNCAHLAMHGKVDRRVDLLDALAARHARPMSGRQRARGHKLGREAESLEPLQEANNKVARLVQREFPSQTLAKRQSVIKFET